MSALPKKKLCWNCEGNVSREIDNCPYCGVYIHPHESEDENYWSPAYTPSEKTEEIPSPLYHHAEEDVEKEAAPKTFESTLSFSLTPFYQSIKEDLLPILLLMSGSVFFLFGLILFLFARDGTLTLQWHGSSWVTFTLLSLPSILFGWHLVNKTDRE